MENYECMVQNLKNKYKEWVKQLELSCKDLLVNENYSNPYYVGLQDCWCNKNTRVLIVGEEGYFYNNSGNGKLASKGKDKEYAAVRYNDIDTLMSWAADCLEKQLQEEAYESKFEYCRNSSAFWTWVRALYKEKRNSAAFGWTELDKICKEKSNEMGQCCLSAREEERLHSTEIKILNEEITILDPTHIIFLGWHRKSLKAEMPDLYKKLYSFEEDWRKDKLIALDFNNKKFIFSYHPNGLGKEFRNNFVELYKNTLD